jgi:hypothetical protein
VIEVATPQQSSTRTSTETAAAVESADPSLVDRLRAEYLEMPGMSLTLDQVGRLCGIEPATCKLVIDALVEAKFLSWKTGGLYIRRTEDPGHMRMATAHLDDLVAPRITRRAS